MPVMSATRGLAPTRPCVAWTSSETNTVRPKPLGARARNGRHGTAIPAANPPANHTRPRRASRHRAHATRAGMTAQILTAAAKPKQAPAQNVPQRAPPSWPRIRSPSNRSTAPSRQNRFSHGSRNSEDDAVAAAG